MAFCPKHCWIRHKGKPHSACSAKTKTGKPCPHHADRELATGGAVCHVHDPNGKAQENIRNAKETKQ